ncbi:PAS domain S-box-containing protein [Caldalkalibacillus uzonensis]|uniref:PAS domain S-box-containing protein n=1 Tax=Caldalkalibacillus uzonensis TaxID=353224 RepID=A0ABU0CUY0_9BACI|nr:sigma 54-interacting transcriptional regulator [Caldalkalibacillus uzonensis]MDQ0339942.1 PAS domain S-box-containing protein [Caldalkalibacillus uzonensis]
MSNHQLLRSDQSDREELNQALKHADQLNKQLELIINSSYDGIYISDSEGNGLKVNDAYTRITGIRAEQLLGKNMKDVVKEGLVSESVTMKVLETKQPVTIMQRAGGKEVLATGSPVFDEEGNIINVITNIRDLTELNRLKEELEKSKALNEKYRRELHQQRHQQQESVLEQLGVVAHSKVMQEVIALAQKVATVDSSVLILGESGVGKEVIAQVIHYTSNRADQPFIKVNCGAIPKNLLESELFGYERGAFTGADSRGKAGLFERADGGTLFLDEIGDMPLDLQVKLLRALQEFEITRVGGSQTIKVNVRVISATNKDLEQLIKEGQFRKDLYYRLNVVPIYIPPIRNRSSDIVPLIYFFLNRVNKKYGLNKVLSKQALQLLQAYFWPGNVREIQNIVERLAVTTEEDEISIDDLPFFINQDHRRQEQRSLKSMVMSYEKEIIQQKLKKYKTTRKTAQSLGISQSALVKKMKRLGIKTET